MSGFLTRVILGGWKVVYKNETLIVLYIEKKLNWKHCRVWTALQMLLRSLLWVSPDSSANKGRFISLNSSRGRNVCANPTSSECFSLLMDDIFCMSHGCIMAVNFHISLLDAFKDYINKHELSFSATSMQLMHTSMQDSVSAYILPLSWRMQRSIYSRWRLSSLFNQGVVEAERHRCSMLGEDLQTLSQNTRD